MPFPPANPLRRESRPPDPRRGRNPLGDRHPARQRSSRECSRVYVLGEWAEMCLLRCACWDVPVPAAADSIGSRYRRLVPQRRGPMGVTLTVPFHSTKSGTPGQSCAGRGFVPRGFELLALSLPDRQSQMPAQFKPWCTAGRQGEESRRANRADRWSVSDSGHHCCRNRGCRNRDKAYPGCRRPDCV